MKLIIKFTDVSSSYAIGCEYGRLLEKFEQGIEVIENNGFPIRLKNKEVVISTCNHYGYTPIFGETHFNAWVEFKAIKNNNLN